MIILGIETSCDETSVSIIRAKSGNLKCLSNVVSSQFEIHSKWGGVVPNLASREHVKNIVPVFSSALKKAGISPDEIDLMAVTSGPGLIPALLIGTNFAKTIAYVWKKPLIGVHHIEAHIYANFLNEPSVEFPVLALVVSGGHTQLMLMKSHLEYEIVGQTLDDAAGEAFDKVARIMNLGYPGGPAISAMAEKFQNTNSKPQIELPRPLIDSKDLNFSFSGLKTAVLYETKKNEELLKDKNYIISLSHEFQQAVIDVLVKKTLKASQKYDPKTIMLAGGVSANKELRKQLGKDIINQDKNISYVTPDIEYSVDNAAMIAIAGYYRWKSMSEKGKKVAIDGWKNVQAEANMKLE